MSNIREKIENHLKLSDRVKEAVAEFLKGNERKGDVIKKHFGSGEDRDHLCKSFDKKIKIIQDKNKYLENKRKIENAVKELSSSSISKVAIKYSISCLSSLYEEFTKFKKSENEYAYNEKIPNSDVFTYRDERSLLLDLNSWKEKSTKDCRCRYCALEYLLKLASKLASKLPSKNQNPFEEDSHKQPDEQWLYEFEMRYSEEISEYATCCRKYPSAPTNPLQPLSSFNVTNILEPSTSSKHQTFEQIDLESDPKSMQEMIKIHERFDIRERIRNFLNLSEKFMPVVEELLVKKNTFETVQQKYKINSVEERRILHSIIFILEENNIYLQEKINYQNAVRLTRSNVTVEDAAQQCNIDPKLLKNEIDNWLDKDIVHEYEYTKIICTLKYLSITYNEEYLLLEKLYTWAKDFQLLCSCRICVLEYLYNLMTDTINKYKDRGSEIHTTSMGKLKKLNEEWLYEFEIRHNKKISEFSSSCKKVDISWVTTWHKFLLLFDKEKVSKTNASSLQGNFDLLQMSNAMMSIRGKIIDHLNLSNRLTKAVVEIANKKENVATVAQKYGFNSKKDRETLNKKIKIGNKQNQYFTLRREIYNYLYLLVSKLLLVSNLEQIKSIPHETLLDENKKYEESRIAYKYDDYVSRHKVLTYNDEFSLLEKLYIWKTESQSCTCQVCALENAFYLNYIFANINELEPQIWENEMIHGNWICEFQMRYTKEISEFLNYSECKRKTVDPQIYNARIQEKERRSKRFEIMNYLSETKWFIRAAEEVVNKKEEVATVVQKYGFNFPEDRDALDKRIDILEKKKKYLELKDKIEKAVKTILSDNITDVAENYNIDKSILNEEFKKYSALENKDDYIYDPFTTCNKILTYSQESMLLTQLEIWKNNLQVSCHCWFCALKYLRKHAYMIANAKRRDPIQWKTHEQADVNWLYEFEMRYSEEISKYLLPFCMTHSLKSTSASDSEHGTSEPLQKRSRTH